MGKIKRIIKLLAILCMLTGLFVNTAMNAFADDSTAPSYISITMEEAKEIFMKDGDYIILDVRRDDEFVEGHIPGAINIANEDIISEPPERLTDFDQVIYVYCRSGRRSKEASAKLADMGYRNIIEFGGILDWTGDVEAGPERTPKRVKMGILHLIFEFFDTLDEDVRAAE